MPRDPERRLALRGRVSVQPRAACLRHAGRSVLRHGIHRRPHHSVGPGLRGKARPRDSYGLGAPRGRGLVAPRGPRSLERRARARARRLRRVARATAGRRAGGAVGRKLKLAATQMDIDKKLKEEFADTKFANDLALALATAKPETKTAAVKNALAMGLEPGTKAFNDYVTAATIKGAGLDIQFSDDGTIKSITEGGVSGNKKFQEQGMELKNATFAMNNVASALLNNLQGAKVGTVGSFFNVLDSFSLSQLGSLTVSPELIPNICV